jgi:hypothetical protein
MAGASDGAGQHVPVGESVRGALPRLALRSPSHAGSYTADLKTRLSIAPGQVQAWKAFADALSANTRRMRSDNPGGDSPFGPIALRLDALISMQRAAQQLLVVLEPAQRRAAVQVVPLCCLQAAPEIRRNLCFTPQQLLHRDTIAT